MFGYIDMPNFQINIRLHYCHWCKIRTVIYPFMVDIIYIALYIKNKIT